MKTFIVVILLLIIFVCLGYELFYGDKHPYKDKKKNEKK